MVSQPEPPEPVTPTAAGRMETSDYGSRSVNRQERKKEKKEDSRAAAVASGLTAAAWLELRAVSEQAEDTEAAATAWSELKLDVGAGGDGRSWKHAAEEEVAFQYMNDTIAAALASSPEVKAERRQSGGFSDDGMDEDPVAAAQREPAQRKIDAALEAEAEAERQKEAERKRVQLHKAMLLRYGMNTPLCTNFYADGVAASKKTDSVVAAKADLARRKAELARRKAEIAAKEKAEADERPTRGRGARAAVAVDETLQLPNGAGELNEAERYFSAGDASPVPLLDLEGALQIQDKSGAGGEVEGEERTEALLSQALARVGGFTEQAIDTLCEQLDLGMLRDHRDDMAFLQDLAGAEWAASLGAACMARLRTCIQNICDPDYMEPEKGLMVGVSAVLMEEVASREGTYWPHPSCQAAELRQETHTAHEKRKKARAKIRMRKFKVVGRMAVTVEGAKDVEKRELDARVVAKQKLVADRHAAVAAAEEAEKRAAEPQGLDAFGPRPLVEYGKGSAYHSAVLDDCHRDEARRNRIPMVDHRYDFGKNKELRAQVFEGSGYNRWRLMRAGGADQSPYVPSHEVDWAWLSKQANKDSKIDQIDAATSLLNDRTLGSSALAGSANTSLDATFSFGQSDVLLQKELVRPRTADPPASAAWPADVKQLMRLSDTTDLPSGACATRPELRPAARAQAATLRPFSAYHREPARQVLQLYRDQPLAARGALRALRWTAPRPMPNPDGPSHKNTLAVHNAKRYAPVVRRLSKSGCPNLKDRKPHYDKPVRVQDFMPPSRRKSTGKSH